MSTTSSVSSYFSTATAEDSGSSRVPTQTLDQQDFLELLTAQLANQDPMEPQSDAEFIATMAEFSALEQTKTMLGDIAAIRASSLLGTTVTVTDEDDETGYTTGVVSSVTVVDGSPQLVIGDSRYDLSAINTIATTETSSTSE